MDNIWICLAKVLPNNINKNIFNDKRGAYVNIVGQAINGNVFEERIKIALLDFDLSLIEMEDLERFEDRIKNADVDISIHKLVDELKIDFKLIFGKFHTYELD